MENSALGPRLLLILVPSNARVLGNTYIRTGYSCIRKVHQVIKRVIYLIGCVQFALFQFLENPAYIIGTYVSMSYVGFEVSRARLAKHHRLSPASTIVLPMCRTISWTIISERIWIQQSSTYNVVKLPTLRKLRQQR